MKQFIKAITDYYGTPKGHQVYINPKYIIKIEFMGECEDSYRNVFKDHYTIVVDMGNTTEKMHITLETGNELLNGENVYGNTTE